MKIRNRFDKVERENIVQIAETYLWEDETKTGLDYLLNIRHLNEEVLRTFRIGYLPDDLDHQLRGRIILPLYDSSNNLICITSRTIKSSQENELLPRYWHEAYEKSFYLYGLQIAKEYMRNWDFAILCEGQIDTLRLHQCGFKNAVAICGTSLHLMQYALIRRYCEYTIAILDNDDNKAGQKGMDKIKRMVSSVSSKKSPWYKNGEYKVGYVQIDKAKDPDEYLQVCGYESLRDKIKTTLAEIRC